MGGPRKELKEAVGDLFDRDEDKARLVHLFVDELSNYTDDLTLSSASRALLDAYSNFEFEKSHRDEGDAE